ncbi:hypothetical protein ACIQH5_05115 [Paenarthrobacter sp. NPDC091711]|uniref:hypothetical protein n=1 Tax=Paenarthrobacter sp. NPDC091711 TaxID=3364385 RepID=UPI00380ED66F
MTTSTSSTAVFNKPNTQVVMLRRLAEAKMINAIIIRPRFWTPQARLQAQVPRTQ